RDAYIHDYLLKRKLHASAKAFMAEGKVATDFVDACHKLLMLRVDFSLNGGPSSGTFLLLGLTRRHSEAAVAYIEEMGQLGVVTSWKLMERAVVQSKAGGFSYDRSVAATDINRRSTIADMEQRNVVMNTDSSIYYLGCIRSIDDVLPFRDANKGQSYWRKIHFTPSTRKDAGKFTVDDILDIHPSIKSPNTGTPPRGIIEEVAHTIVTTIAAHKSKTEEAT
ncbi:transcriptional corepressor LEUNIG_homolog isoform X1, partial [Tanacetum coccineum]